MSKVWVQAAVSECLNRKVTDPHAIAKKLGISDADAVLSIRAFTLGGGPFTEIERRRLREMGFPKEARMAR